MSQDFSPTECPVCDLDNQTAVPTYKESTDDIDFHTRNWKCVECTRDALVRISLAKLYRLKEHGPVGGREKAQQWVDCAIASAKRDKRFTTIKNLTIDWPN
jgi:hypothetical protein